MRHLGFLAVLALWTTAPAFSRQEPDRDGLFAALRVRGIGPAFMSGRVTDFAVNEANPAEYFVASASGGVWKTVNNGTTFTPLFDDQGSFSIGCVELDPKNPDVVWVGTGENNSQRSVAFGDGVYKSLDGGKSWRRMGLEHSEHIGGIAIHPRKSAVVYVAAQGPLWSAGGDRGLYRTKDGGETWEQILFVSEHTGINEIHMDPRDPDILYASAYQRRRHVWTLVNGGPESAIYKSTDGGDSWRKVTRGLPNADMGRIGMDVSPANPDVVYAIIEAAEDAGGTYRSLDRGESWEKRSGYVSGSPQYYNEIFCHPHEVDTVYAMDTYLQVTRDGGATFQAVPIVDKHVDEHALWIDPRQPGHMLSGCDGGVYETWDGAEHWDFKTNLPLTQFYRVAVDDAEPFYNVIGGTQDNASQLGPSRTIDRAGISNAEWTMTVMGDGFESRIEPGDPDTVYSLVQYGELMRYDRRSGEIVDIKPQEGPGEEPYVWNWDAPFLVSSHSPARLYFAGDRLFRSEDRGNSWAVISGDLTRQIDRNSLEVMGELQKPEAVAKNTSTSIYGNAVALSESPVDEKVLYVGTDDGLIHVTRDGGATWSRLEAFPDVPHRTYVSFLTASQHQAGRVYAAFNNHKMGDFTPYLLRSDDFGATWTSLAEDLPARNFVWSVAEDHVDADLLFVGTEFSAYYSFDGGREWVEVSGLPTVAVRDLEIQRRENDLVLATFGRGFYILDDYSPLREVKTGALEAEAHLFAVKPARSYIETSRLGMASGRGFQGAAYYAASNPPFGAVFTIHLKEGLKTRAEARQERQKGEEWRYPDIEEFRAEDEELPPRIILTIRDSGGVVVRRLAGPLGAGVHRVTWDLRGQDPNPISLSPPAPPMWAPPSAGALVPPGEYTVTLSKEVDAVSTDLAGPVAFSVEPLDLARYAATGEQRQAAHQFRQQVAELARSAAGAAAVARDAASRIALVRRAIETTPSLEPSLLARIDGLRKNLIDIQTELSGDSTRARRSEPTLPSILGRIGRVVGDQWWVTSAPTQTQRDQHQHARDAFVPVLKALRQLVEKDLPQLETDLDAAGAPWTPGRLPQWNND